MFTILITTTAFAVSIMVTKIMRRVVLMAGYDVYYLDYHSSPLLTYL